MTLSVTLGQNTWHSCPRLSVTVPVLGDDQLCHSSLCIFCDTLARLPPQPWVEHPQLFGLTRVGFHLCKILTIGGHSSGLIQLLR